MAEIEETGQTQRGAAAQPGRTGVGSTPPSAASAGAEGYPAAPNEDTDALLASVIDDPQRWATISLDQKIQCIQRLGVLCCRERADRRWVDALWELYPRFDQEGEPHVRSQVIDAVAAAVDGGFEAVNGIVNFILLEGDPRVGATAVICMVRLAQNDFVGRPRGLAMLQDLYRHPQTTVRVRCSIMSGLLLLGDACTLPYLYELWDLLDVEHQQLALFVTDGIAYASTVEFLLHQLAANRDDDLRGGLAAKLYRLPQETLLGPHPGYVIDVERRFPANLRAGQETVTLVQEWTLAEYADLIIPRLRTLVSDEPEPQVLPLVIQEWTTPSDTPPPWDWLGLEETDQTQVAEDVEALLASVIGDPQRWATISRDQRIQVIERLGVLSCQAGADVRWGTALWDLYPRFVQEVEPHVRSQVVDAVAQAVEVGTPACNGLVTILLRERDPHVGATATINIAHLAPASDKNPLLGLAMLRDLFEQPTTTPEGRTSIVAGLLLLGDRRALPYLDDLWGALEFDRQETVLHATTGFAYASTIEFLLHQVEAHLDDDLMGGLAAALYRLPQETLAGPRPGYVIDVERHFPSSLRDGTPTVTLVQEWTLAEYAKLIVPRLRTLARREAKPKVLPYVIKEWTTPSDNPLPWELIF